MEMLKKLKRYYDSTIPQGMLSSGRAQTQEEAKATKKSLKNIVSYFNSQSNINNNIHKLIQKTKNSGCVAIRLASGDKYLIEYSDIMENWVYSHFKNDVVCENILNKVVRCKAIKL